MPVDWHFVGYASLRYGLLYGGLAVGAVLVLSGANPLAIMSLFALGLVLALIGARSSGGAGRNVELTHGAPLENLRSIEPEFLTGPDIPGRFKLVFCGLYTALLSFLALVIAGDGLVS